MNILNYSNLKKINETKNTLVYKGIKIDDNKNYILEILKLHHPFSSEIFRFKHVMQVVNKMKHDDVSVNFLNQDFHIENEFCFIHQRIQEAAYSLILDEEKTIIEVKTFSKRALANLNKIKPFLYSLQKYYHNSLASFNDSFNLIKDKISLRRLSNYITKWIKNNLFKQLENKITPRKEHNNCNQWEAIKNVKQIERTYPDLQKRTKKREREMDFPIYSSNSKLAQNDVETFNLTTVLNSPRAISNKMVLEKILKKFINLLLENAGAQKVVLILKNNFDHNLYVEAEGIKEKEIKIPTPVSLDKYNLLPHSILNYVNKTMESIVLEDASGAGELVKDPYIMENKTKSLLCIPILHMGESIGILYLENNLLTNSFTQEKVELLKIISSQSAVSIINAKLMILREEEETLNEEMEITDAIDPSLIANKPRISSKEGYVLFKQSPNTYCFVSL